MRIDIVVLLAGLLSFTAALAWTMVRLRGSCSDPAARFLYGYQGAFALLVAMVCSFCLCILLAKSAPRPEAVLGAVVVNLLAQPIAILYCWLGARKVAFGMIGRVDYVGRLVPEAELSDLSPSAHRGLVGFNILRGILGLFIGAALSLGCAWPIVRWISL